MQYNHLEYLHFYYSFNFSAGAWKQKNPHAAGLVLQRRQNDSTGFCAASISIKAHCHSILSPDVSTGTPDASPPCEPTDPPGCTAELVDYLTFAF
ncbi:hypothetical protein D3C77_355630 [compost metagenome]